MVNCIYDQHHRVPAATASKHMQECAFRKEGYDRNEKLLSEPNFIPGSTVLIGKSISFYNHNKIYKYSWIFADDTTKIQVLNQALANNPSMKTGMLLLVFKLC